MNGLSWCHRARFWGVLRAQGNLWAIASKNMEMSILQPQRPEFSQPPERAWKKHWALSDSTVLKTPRLSQLHPLRAKVLPKPHRLLSTETWKVTNLCWYKPFRLCSFVMHKETLLYNLILKCEKSPFEHEMNLLIHFQRIEYEKREVVTLLWP